MIQYIVWYKNGKKYVVAIGDWKMIWFDWLLLATGFWGLTQEFKVSTFFFFASDLRSTELFESVTRFVTFSGDWYFKNCFWIELADAIKCEKDSDSDPQPDDDWTYDWNHRVYVSCVNCWRVCSVQPCQYCSTHDLEHSSSNALFSELCQIRSDVNVLGTTSKGVQRQRIIIDVFWTVFSIIIIGR